MGECFFLLYKRRSKHFLPVLMTWYDPCAKEDEDRMRHKLVMFLATYTCSSVLLYGIKTAPCNVTLQPVWQQLQDASKPFDGRWIFAGTITFRTKLLEPIELTTLVLSWHGVPLDNLLASLYRTEVNEPFLAIDNHWVCDGTWNQEKQRLIFKMHTKKNLSAITHFHLVLTVPLVLESTIKKGSFTLEPDYLPLPYQTLTQPLLSLHFACPT
jgi:hypothetical protein